MSTKPSRIVDRPPQGGSCRPVVLSSLWRAFLVMGSAFVLLASPVAAQDYPRIDPGTPPPVEGGLAEGWEVLSIPGLPAGAVLGDVWATPSGIVYVWAKYPQRVPVNSNDDTGEGEKLPNPPGEPTVPWSSNLYRFDGTRWAATLRTPGEMGGALKGWGENDLFASTTSEQGEAKLYHLNNGVWNQEVLPGHYYGRLHTLVGEPNDLYFKIDRVILRHDGVSVSRMFELPPNESAEKGMVDLGSDGLFVMSGDCHYLYDNGVWACVEAGFDFGHVEDAWGMRDTNGRLHMYAIGEDFDHSGFKVWQYDENDPAIHDGIWVPVLQDPMSGHVPDLGGGFHLWGGAGNDVYATGVVQGEGHMMRFDGRAWHQLASPQSFGAIHGVWGTGGGAVWFSTEAGQVVRYARSNTAPDVAFAVPSIARLWPANGQFTAVDILGVVDPEGDQFTLTIDRVLSDEDPVTPNVAGNCPDARIAGSRVMLRAEHKDNGDGRTYVIEFTATDQYGLSSRGHVHVCAPHFESTPCDVDAATFDATGPCAPPTTGRRPFDTGDNNGALRVHYELETAGPVHLGIYDVAGRLRGVIEEGPRAAGVHEKNWDLSGLDAGVYFVKLRTAGPAFTSRVVVLH